MAFVKYGVLDKHQSVVRPSSGAHGFKDFRTLQQHKAGESQPMTWQWAPIQIIRGLHTALAAKCCPWIISWLFLIFLRSVWDP